MSSALSLMQIRGNERLVKLLARGGLPQASLFVGPDGVGKKTVALLLAAKANCQDPPNQDLCGKCSSCLKVQSENHPDIRLIQREEDPKTKRLKQSISIEQMRGMSREVQFRPYEGRLRFFIINEAEKLKEEAANSILKTLEEPPETSRIVLVSAYPQRLLPTILSRCQRFQFQPLGRAEILDYLEQETDLEDAELRAAFSEGSLGTALELDVADTVERRNRMLEILSDWLEAQRFEAVFKHSSARPLSGELRKRDQVRVYLQLLETLCIDLYHLLNGMDERLVNADCGDKLRRLSQSVALDEVRDLLYHIAESLRDLDRNVSPLICFETLWLGPQFGAKGGSG